MQIREENEKQNNRTDAQRKRKESKTGRTPKTEEMNKKKQKRQPSPKHIEETPPPPQTEPTGKLTHGRSPSILAYGTPSKKKNKKKRIR